MPAARQVLLIDADDTLWETNLRFERTLEAFCEIVSELGHKPAEVRACVDRAERLRIRQSGYGEAKFLATLEEVYAELAGAKPEPRRVKEVRDLARHLVAAPLRVFEGVRETLAYLAARHRLLLFTKGGPREQRRKVAGTGLGKFFAAREVVPEKNRAAYRAVLARHRLRPATVWMVGDSPRSDINPALAIGLNAVFIPTPHNWEYENEEIRRGRGRLLVLKRFRDLRDHF